MADNQEMPIFTRTFDYLTWLLPLTNHFPRAHRFTFTQRLLNAAFELRERLEEAQHRSGKARMGRLAAGQPDSGWAKRINGYCALIRLSAFCIR
jgi:hypothetical protein